LATPEPKFGIRALSSPALSVAPRHEAAIGTQRAEDDPAREVQAVIVTVVSLLFVLIAFVWIVDCLFPGWRGNPPSWAFAFTISGLIKLVIGLVILYIVYLIVMAVLHGLALP
jgi:hypothetical protein